MSPFTVVVILLLGLLFGLLSMLPLLFEPPDRENPTPPQTGETA